MAKTANQLIKQAYEIAKTMPPEQAAIIKELATVLDVSNVALRQTRTERDALRRGQIRRKSVIVRPSDTPRSAQIYMSSKQCAT